MKLKHRKKGVSRKCSYCGTEMLIIGDKWICPNRKKPLSKTTKMHIFSKFGRIMTLNKYKEMIGHGKN